MKFSSPPLHHRFFNQHSKRDLSQVLNDLAKCFDEAKTGIPVERIHEIGLCHNSRLATKEDFEPIWLSTNDDRVYQHA